MLRFSIHDAARQLCASLCHTSLYLIIFCAPIGLFAEGSKDFVNYQGYRLFLDTRDDQQLKVYANAGETINVGSSHVGIQGGFIKVYDPTGALVATFDNTGTTQGKAIIYNHIEEQNGPTGGGSTNGLGYKPGTVTVPSGLDGIWTIIMDYPSHEVENFNNLLNNAPWNRAIHQPNNRRVVLAWDITVSQNGAGNEGGTLLEGRVYSNEYISLVQLDIFLTSPIFYVLTNDGYIYEVKLHEIGPFRFPISSNSLGLTDGNRKPIYKSKKEVDFKRSDKPSEWLADSLYLYEPQAKDDGVLVNNKLFFNIPNPDLPASANVYDIFRNTSHSTWLLKPMQTLSIDSLYLIGEPGSGAPCSLGSIESGNPAYFIFETNIGGVATVELDLNNNGSFTDSIDLRLTAPINAGIDEVVWNGKDGLGNPIPVQNQFAFNYRGSVKFGEVHIAFTDVERTNGGVTFRWMNAPPGYIDNQFYYDNSEIGGGVSGGGQPGNALPTTQPYAYSNDFGNDRYIDHWCLVQLEIPSTPMSIDVVGECFAEPTEIELLSFGNGFDRPIDMAHCGDERLFIAEQKGMIWILDENGNKLPEPFLDLRDRVGTQGEEQGLLGISFHPDFLENGFLYVNYTMPDSNTRISRFTVLAANPNLADPASEFVLMDIEQPFANNNGGSLKFGPDGYLYIATGDGGGEGDPFKNAQNLNSPLGKILRIDVDNGSPYAIPPTNPYHGSSDAKGEVWAFGLRNPAKFSFDAATGDLWLGDQGQGSWEEVDFQPANSIGGENYGWRCFEGNEDYSVAGCEATGSMAFPAYQYANFHTIGCGVVGGHVYRGCGAPALFGMYIFTDRCTGRIWAMSPNEQVKELAHFPESKFSALGENSLGELFLLGTGNGTVYKINSDLSALTITNETCATANDGQAKFNIPTDQLAAFAWSDGSSLADRTDLSPGTYGVTVTTNNGCEFSETVEIVAGSGPTSFPMLTATAESCVQKDDGQVNFNIPTDQFTTIIWNDGSSLANRTDLAPGSYSVTVTMPNGCSFSETVEIAGGEDPMPIVVQDQNGVLYTEASASQYQWLLNGTQIVGATQASFLPAVSGDYSVQIITAAGCKATSAEVTVELISSNAEKAYIQSVAISPNPTEGDLYLNIRAAENTAFTLKIMDASGKILVMEDYRCSGSFEQHFDLHKLPAGSYLLTVLTADGFWSKKIIKK